MHRGWRNCRASAIPFALEALEELRFDAVAVFRQRVAHDLADALDHALGRSHVAQGLAEVEQGFAAGIVFAPGEFQRQRAVGVQGAGTRVDVVVAAVVTMS